MSWLFSRALVEEFLAGTCSDGEPSAQLSVMPTAQPFWRRGKTMDFSQPSPSGQTFALLTEDRGRELLTSFLAGFPAKTSAPRERAPASKASEAASGDTWPAIVGEVRPRHVFVENSPMLTSRGLGTVLGDLAALGFDARWGVLGASALGFPTDRERIWIALPTPSGVNGGKNNTMGRIDEWGGSQQPIAWDRHWLDVFTRVRGNGDGMADRLDRTDAIRNGQVPAVAGQAAIQSAGDMNRAPELPGAIERLRHTSEGLLAAIDSLDNRLSGVVARPSSPTPVNEKSQIRGAMNTGMGSELDGLNERLGQAYTRVSSMLDRLEF
jgi:hypothetical protein